MYHCTAWLNFLGLFDDDDTGDEITLSGIVRGTHSTMFEFWVVQKTSSPNFLRTCMNAQIIPASREGLVLIW